MIDRRRIRRRSVDAQANLERELVAERAGALGRVGRRLEEAIAAWESLATVDGVSDEERDDMLRELRDAAYALIVQRDCAGFRMDNLAWIRRYYEVPEAALRRI